jgi:hypothetical protein
MSAGHVAGGGGGDAGGGGGAMLADADRTGGSAPPSGRGDDGATGLDEHAATSRVRPKTAGLLMMMEV